MQSAPWFVAAATACFAASAGAAEPDISQLGWLAGCWKHEQAEAGSEERWMPAAGGTMLGVSRTVKQGRTVESEFMEIRHLPDGRLAYIAHPSGQETATFVAKQLGTTEVIFENLQHDFPQRVAYAKDGEAGLAARIEGMRNGSLRVIRFPMSRVRCDVATGSSSSNAEVPAVNDPSRTTYGEMSARAPQQLRAFSFIVGKWDGKGRTRLPDGKFAEFPVTWIGRYILDGTAVSDEMHSLAPDGSPYLGISLRQYDAARGTWVIEYLNVSGSFLRRQVNADSGSVKVAGQDVIVESESPGVSVREHYLVPDAEHFTYRLDVSSDGGRSWNESQIEMSFQRVK
jgi:hypothetical protein